MSDVFWAALIGAGSAVLSAWLTNRFNARETARQITHSERQARLQWEWSEARRKAEEARDDALRKEERRAFRLREFWAHVLTSEVVMVKWLDWIDRGRTGPSPDASAEAMPTFPALHANAVALLELTDVYPLARDFFRATVKLEDALFAGGTVFDVARKRWDRAYLDLERKVGDLTGAVGTPGALLDEEPVDARKIQHPPQQ